MLATQVQYWTLQESIQHNRNTEAETSRSNKENEKISWFNAHENQRHNMKTEEISWFNAQENQRHNLATEKLGWSSLAEQHRSNLEQESIARYNAESGRMNALSTRMNAYTQARQVEYTYSLGLEANRISQQNADTNRFNSMINAKNAQTREFEAKTARYSAEQRAGVDWFNAATRANELENSRRETDIHQSKLDLDVSQYHWKQAMDVTNVLLDVGKTALRYTTSGNPSTGVGQTFRSLWNNYQLSTATP